MEIIKLTDSLTRQRLKAAKSQSDMKVADTKTQRFLLLDCLLIADFDDAYICKYIFILCKPYRSVI